MAKEMFFLHPRDKIVDDFRNMGFSLNESHEQVMETLTPHFPPTLLDMKENPQGGVA